MDSARAEYGGHKRPVPEPKTTTTFTGLIEALSYALDLTEGACPGHAVRTCIIGMRMGRELGLDGNTLHDLYYALLLKDVGCSSNSLRLSQIVGNDEIAAKRLTKTTDWTRFEWKQMQYMLKHAHAKAPGGQRLRGIASMVRRSSQNAEELIRMRCDKGSKVARDLGLGHGTAGAIYCLDEHWDGLGYPDRLAGEDIPLLARIVSIAQVYEVFQRTFGEAAAVDVLQRRSGRWFEPELVRVAMALSRRGELLRGLEDECLAVTVREQEPVQRMLRPDSYTIDNICVAFAGVVDAKSPYTFQHSTGVASVALKIGKCLNLSSRELVTLRRSGLLHDIGKLSVPNCILDKPDRLLPDEWQVIRMHPHYTYQILSRIAGFEEIAGISAAHHEKLDGSGYHLGLKAEQLSQLARILTVADMFDALSGERPYRQRMTPDEVMAILRRDAPHAIDRECLAALESFAGEAKNVA